MICEQSGCGCALVVASGTVTGSGTPDDPWVLDVADSPSITQLQVDVANIFSALDALPGTYVNVTGDTMTGPLAIAYASEVIKMSDPGANAPYFSWYDSTGTTRRGYIQYEASGLMTLNSEVGGSAVRFIASGSDVARFLGNNIMFFKAASTAATVGFEFNGGGLQTTTGAASTSLHDHNKVSAGASASGSIFTQYMLSGSVIGSIIRNAATSAVLYNTTSDERMKTVLGDLDPELAEYVLGLVTPMMFAWNDDEGNTPIAGYIAQQVAAAWPEAIEAGFVSPGYGDITDRTFDSEGNETTEPGVWGPWQMDKSVLIPLLHASLVRTTTRLSYLRAEFDELVQRVEALEAATP